MIYPVLGLTHNEFIYNNSFFVALAFVFGLSWLLQRAMPSTFRYEYVMRTAPILENIYTGDVKSFSKRLNRDALVETIASIYFFIASFAIILNILFSKESGEWFTLLVFGFITVGAIIRSTKLINAKFALKADPTPQKCEEIALNLYQVDYASYYEAHRGLTYAEMLPPKPKYFTAFRIFSLIVAGLVALLGIIFIGMGVLLAIKQMSFEAGTFAGVNFLYGSLATYFGIKDFVEIIRSFKRKVA